MFYGAGLAMATMDIIKLYGVNPANFWTSSSSRHRRR
jgi:succinyl-CoA synthetase beta subunit